MTNAALLSMGFCVGLAFGVLATITVALATRDREEDADVHCTRCGKPTLLDIYDGAWVCLECGYCWDDPDLPRGWSRVDGTWHAAYAPDVH